MLPADVLQPASHGTQAQASEKVGNICQDKITWNKDQPQRAGPRVRITGGSIAGIIGRVGLVQKTGQLAQEKGTGAIVYLILLDDKKDGKDVYTITLQKFTSDLDGTQASLASPAAGIDGMRAAAATGSITAGETPTWHSLAVACVVFVTFRFNTISKQEATLP